MIHDDVNICFKFRILLFCAIIFLSLAASSSQFLEQECTQLSCQSLDILKLQTVSKLLKTLKCCCFERVHDPLIGKVISFNLVRAEVEKTGTFNNTNFFEEFFEIQQRTILAASLGIGGNSTIRDLSFDLATCHGLVMREAFLESLSRIDLSAFGESIKNSASRMLESTFSSTRAFDVNRPEFSAANYRGGGDHLFSIYFSSITKQLMIGNRGRRPKHIPPGISVFSTENAEEAELIEIFKFLESNEPDYYKKLYDNLNRKLGPPIAHISLEEQRVGNCAWVAFEMTFLSYVFAHHTLTESDWQKDYGQSLSALNAVQLDRARTYIHSPSKIKSMLLLEYCLSFEANSANSANRPKSRNLVNP